MNKYETVELADAREGDEVYQAGRWSPVERVTVFGSRRDLVSIRWVGGGTHSGPLSHMGKARRPVEVDGCELAVTRVADEAHPPCVYCGRHHVEGAALVVLVSRLHGADVASYLADTYPATLPLVANGWTTDGAIAHVEGSCDIAICTGVHA